MIDAIVGIVGFIAKSIALLIALSFWLTVGFFIWTRHVIVSFILLIARITVVPLAEAKDGEDPPESTASQRFDAALRLWPEGFSKIIRAIRGAPQPQPQTATPRAAPKDGFWKNFLRYTVEGGAALLFWAPVIVIVHHTGLWKIDLIDRIERPFVQQQAQAAPPARPPSAASAPAAAEPAACLGESAVVRLNPPHHFVTKQKVNVRQGAGTHHRKLGELQGGQNVSALGRSLNNEWALVSVDGEVRCFVATRYLEEPPS